MKKTMSLVLGVLFLLNAVSSFFSDAETDEFLWIEMNIWIYRLIWLIGALVMFSNYFSLKKQENKSE